MTQNRKVLLVDDEVHVLQAAKRVLRRTVEVTTANGPQEALEKIKAEGPFAVVVSDQNMPGVDGIKLLGHISKKAPSTTRIMLTGNNDQKTAMNAVNDGRIFRFVTKPCDSERLSAVIEEGIAHHQTVVAERELLEQTLSGSVKMLVDIIAVSRPRAHLRASIIQRWARKVNKALDATPSLEQGISAMLCTLGYLTLPDSLADRYFGGADLSPAEKASVNEAAAMARDLVLNIPRMEGIAEAIYYCRKGYDGSGFPEDDRKGEDIPVAARVLCALIDLAEISVDETPSFVRCMEELEANAPRYDPNVLEVMRQVLGGDQHFAGSPNADKISVPILQLLAGDILAADIRDAEDRLLLAAGSLLSPITLKRIRSNQTLMNANSSIEVWREVPQNAGEEKRSETVS
ncbi:MULTISPECIES: HD domain-containing phosphohydrolase [unclassified Roseibium]|uniref:HD domain-containing phosphohydrolase n=1 Tax=unclassified Roseibium TaxID=2629323 RepID=UPI00273F7305|nr:MULTISPECIES: HD domain-containing phosphohydrolase [unclassified Roseibium]